MAGGRARSGGSEIVRRCLPVLFLAAVLLLLLPSPSWSHGSRSSSSLTGSITSFAGGIKVSVTNSGTDSFNYIWIRMVSSVHHTGASIAPSGGCGPGPDSNTVKCAESFDGFPPGKTYVVTILTDKPYPANAGADLFTGSSTNGPLNPAGKATGPEAPPAKTPCTCTQLAARILPSSILLRARPGYDIGPIGESTLLELDFNIHWVLSCSAGDGGGCRGTVKPTVVPGHSVNPAVGAVGSGQIVCLAGCGKVQHGDRRYRLTGGLTRVTLAGKTIPITIHLTCQGKALAPIQLRFAFDRVGRVSLAKSKLQ